MTDIQYMPNICIYYLSLYFIIEELLLEFGQGVVCAVIVQVQRIQNIPGGDKSMCTLFWNIPFEFKNEENDPLPTSITIWIYLSQTTVGTLGIVCCWETAEPTKWSVHNSHQKEPIDNFEILLNLFIYLMPTIL